MPQLSLYKRKLAIVAILTATVLLLVITSSLTIGSVLAVKTGATHKIKRSSKDLKDLFACESTASKGHGGLTQDALMNCYTKTFKGNLAVPAAPDFGSSNGSISHTHNHSSGKSTSSPSAAALSGLR